MNDARGPYRIAWLLLLLAALFSVLYHGFLMPLLPGEMDPDDFSRGIGTPFLKVLNGYGGVFFNLRYLSPLAVLALPVLVLALVYWRRLPIWKRALVAFVLLSVGVISGLGGFNYRYALTLLPLFTILVVTAAWRVLPIAQRRGFGIGLLALCLLNLGLTIHHRKRMADAMRVYDSPDTAKGKLSESLDSSPRDLDAWLSANGVKPGDTVLVNNLPIWYYVTDRPGIYYWCGSDQLFLERSKPFLFKGRNEDQVLRYLQDSLHCRYVFSLDAYNGYDPRFLALLEHRATLLAQDPQGHTLHRLSDNFPR